MSFSPNENSLHIRRGSSKVDRCVGVNIDLVYLRVGHVRGSSPSHFLPPRKRKKRAQPPLQGWVSAPRYLRELRRYLQVLTQLDSVDKVLDAGATIGIY